MEKRNLLAISDLCAESEIELLKKEFGRFEKLNFPEGE
jgi:hypothetical protein